MGISHVPRGFTSVTPYFHLTDGRKFTEFVKAAFDAEVIDDHRNEEGILLHGAFKIYGSMIEGSDATAEWPATKTSIHMYVPDCDEVYQQAVKAGGKKIHEPVDQEYGERAGAVEDPCGNRWYIATQKVEMYPEQSL
ncbi:MAG: VOC family protein [Pyrinomonadaceae bacterium]|nr:VOC family protein [Pyrinomonadaceae bacterium]